jgi:Flp pilus assembly pilin Flp
MNEEDDAKYGAVAALASFVIILAIVAVLGVILGAWS